LGNPCTFKDYVSKFKKKGKIKVVDADRGEKVNA